MSSFFSKTKFKTLSEEERECEEAENYNWGDCLDEMFYLRKGKCLFTVIKNTNFNIISLC